MNEKQANKLPPIIEQYIGKLTDKHTTSFQKDIAAAQLENIRDQVTIALDQYNKQTRKAARKC